MQVCACLWTLGVFVYHSPPWLLRQHLSLNLSFDNSASLVDQQSLGILSEVPSVSCKAWVYIFNAGAGDLYAGTASALPTEQSP